MSTVSLRPLQDSDLPNLVEYAGNKAIFDRLTDGFPHPFDEAAGRAFIKRQSEKDPIEVLAIILDGDLIGCIGIHPKSDVDRLNAELGYWIGEPFWGKGIMPQAIEQMIPYAFANFEIHRIFARPYGDNPASQRVLEKAGFVLEARFEKTLIKNGELKDELIYAFRKPV